MINSSKYLDGKNKELWLGFGTLVLIVYSMTVFAGTSATTPDWTKMIMQLFGGLAIFLFGMEQMTDALRSVAGERMKNILAKLTGNRFSGVLTGAGVTAVVQSSSVTTVIVVGFVTAGLMNLQQAVGVIFGANIGTTITAQIVAFKVTKYALWMVSIGFGMFFIGKEEKIKQYGAMLMGLGLVFFGMGIMSGAMKPLRSFQPFLDLMVNMENPIIGILVAAAFTGLVQSSSATTSIVIVMAGEGFITLPAGIALAFGANIGTCVTALLAAIGKPRVAVQAAIAHLLFNVGGVLLWVMFIPYLAQFVTSISPAASEGVVGTAKLALEAPRQIANAHTIFNIINTLVFLPILIPFTKLVERLVPLKEHTVEEKILAGFKPKYLDDGMLTTPSLALSMVRREAQRMGESVESMITGIPDAVFTGNMEKMELLKETDDRVDALYGAINQYIGKIGREKLSTANAEEAISLATTTTELENIGDIVEIHMHHLALMCQSNDISFTDEELQDLNNYHGKVLAAYKSAIVAIEFDRKDAAKLVLDVEEDIIGGMNKLVEDRQKHFLQGDHSAREMSSFTLQTDIMENLKRIYEHTKRIAKLVTKEEGSTALMMT